MLVFFCKLIGAVNVLVAAGIRRAAGVGMVAAGVGMVAAGVGMVVAGKLAAGRLTGTAAVVVAGMVAGRVADYSH